MSSQMPPVTTNGRQSFDVLVFDDLEGALSVYKELGIAGDGTLCFGVRLRTGSVVVLASVTPDGPAKWQELGDQMPIGGAALIGRPALIDEAEALAERVGHHRTTLDHIVAVQAQQAQQAS